MENLRSSKILEFLVWLQTGKTRNSLPRKFFPSNQFAAQCGKVVKNTITAIFFPSNRFTKIHEFRLSQMDVFTPLGGICRSNQWNTFCREGFEVKLIQNEVVKFFKINVNISLPNIAYFQTLITSSSVHLRQVFQRRMKA